MIMFKRYIIYLNYCHFYHRIEDNSNFRLRLLSICLAGMCQDMQSNGIFFLYKDYINSFNRFETIQSEFFKISQQKNISDISLKYL